MANLVDLKIENGDIVLDGFDLATVEENEATRQRLEQKFRLFFGEWFLDRTAGVRWFEDYLGQRPRTEVLQFLLTSVVGNDPDVQRLVEASFQFNGTTRLLEIEFTALLFDGETITLEVAI